MPAQRNWNVQIGTSVGHITDTHVSTPLPMSEAVLPTTGPSRPTLSRVPIGLVAPNGYGPDNPLTPIQRAVGAQRAQRLLRDVGAAAVGDRVGDLLEEGSAGDPVPGTRTARDPSPLAGRRRRSLSIDEIAAMHPTPAPSVPGQQRKLVNGRVVTHVPIVNGTLPNGRRVASGGTRPAASNTNPVTGPPRRRGANPNQGVLF